MLVEDWNDRIGEEQETKQKRSQDKIINGEGMKLLDLCQEYDLTVMNGRSERDEESGLTYVGYQGASVIDLILVKDGDEAFQKTLAELWCCDDKESRLRPRIVGISV